MSSAQLAGVVLAAWSQSVIHVSATYGANYPAPHYTAGAAFWMEAVLTVGLVSVILGTAFGAQNVGLFGAIGVCLHRTGVAGDPAPCLLRGRSIRRSSAQARPDEGSRPFTVL